MTFKKRLNALKTAFKRKHISIKQVVTVSTVATFILSGAVFGMLSNFGAKPNTADTISKEQFSVNVNNSKLGEHLNRKYASGISLGSKGDNKIESASITRSNKLTLNYSYATLRKPSDRLRLKASLERKGIPLSCIWSSSDDSVAVVEADGTVVPKKKGKTTITCIEKNTCLIARCTVAVDVESVVLSDKSIALPLNGSKVITATMPKNIKDKELIWSSSNESVATVDSHGRVTSVSAGEAIITCSAADCLSAQCKITVKDKYELKRITLNYIDIEFYGLGCAEQLVVTEYLPDNASKKGVTWSSTDEAVAVVDDSGVVTPVNNGSCEIVATAVDGSKVSSRCPVTVSGVENYVEVQENYEPEVPINISVSETANSIIEEAEKYVGWLPYVWGGTDLTSGVDCSGFVCAVYERFGINLWGLRTELIYAGREVSLEEARAGDIIVYYGHVALYDGNGGKIHAPQPGYTVTHDYGIGSYRSIRRIIE